MLEVGLIEEVNGSLPPVLPYPLVEVGLVDDERGSVERVFPKWLPGLPISKMLKASTKGSIYLRLRWCCYCSW